MFVLNNDFDPELVIREILDRQQDSPATEFNAIQSFLENWTNEWYEGSIEEEDNLIQLLFGSLPIVNVKSIKVLPLPWRFIDIEFEETEVTSVGFPIILVEYF